MATEDHLNLSEQIKNVHKKLRWRTRKCGAENAWREHLKSKSRLEKYAKAMKDLAINYWEENDKKSTVKIESRSRILWSVSFCTEYFLNTQIVSAQRNRELRIEKELQAEIPAPSVTREDDILAASQRMELFKARKIDLLDVGSCYNPFGKFAEFNVTAIDIAPAVPEVLQCDFLNLQITDGQRTPANQRAIEELHESSFDVIVFSLLLEYLPTSEQRIQCCEKAVQLLRPEGILLVITPDSKHVGANAKLMKTWRYTLALMGLSRIKYEKLEHITCMAFRKCLNADVAKRWARIHKEDYMEFKIEIPQDSYGSNVDMDCGENSDSDGAKINVS